jgi:hypothetical protein
LDHPAFSDVHQKAAQHRGIDGHELGVEAAEQQDAKREGLLVSSNVQVDDEGFLYSIFCKSCSQCRAGPPSLLHHVGGFRAAEGV